MAMSSVIRIASSTGVPLPLCAIASPRILRSGSMANASRGTQDSIVKMEIPFISHNFSTDAKKLLDRKLGKILKSEIKSAKLLDLEKSRPQTPPHFPFTIKDNPGAKELHLEREFAGEKIYVFINQPYIAKEDNEQESDARNTDVSDDDSNDDNGGGGGPTPHVMLDMLIKKETDETLKVFELRVAVDADTVTILTITLGEMSDPDTGFQDYGPYFVDPVLEIDLHDALRRYIEVRGITVTNGVFWYKYMVWKAKRDRMIVLEKVKKFLKE